MHRKGAYKPSQADTRGRAHREPGRGQREDGNGYPTQAPSGRLHHSGGDPRPGGSRACRQGHRAGAREAHLRHAHERQWPGGGQRKGRGQGSGCGQTRGRGRSEHPRGRPGVGKNA